MNFNQWLIYNGYITDPFNIEFELSSVELDILYNIWKNHYGFSPIDEEE